MVENVWFLVGFLALIFAVLTIDLGFFQREAHAVSVKEAGIWTAVWISLALAFCLVMYLFWDRLVPASSYTNGEASLAFLTAYLIEYALSVDNIFVFVMLFAYFAVPAAYQHRVLFWGVLGALVMRGALIVTGSALIARFEWLLYLFGAFLIYTGVKMAWLDDSEVEPENNPVVKWARRFLPFTEGYEGAAFFVRRSGRLLGTPLLLVLLVVETTDLMFALDSIPAILAISREPFIIFTSNVFAILGLRSLYFLLAGMMDKFHLLKLGLAVVLAFVGFKMVTSHLIHIPMAVSLGVVAGVLVLSVVASLLLPPPVSVQVPSDEQAPPRA